MTCDLYIQTYERLFKMHEQAAKARVARTIMATSDELQIARLEAKRQRVIAERNAAELDRVSDERDMLAQTVREQTRNSLSADAIIDAIRARFDEDGALHFDALRDHLVMLGARP